MIPAAPSTSVNDQVSCRVLEPDSSTTIRKPYGVFLVEDHALTRMAVATLVNADPDFYICGQADSALEALMRIAKLEPAVIVADITLRSGNGIELFRKLRTLQPGVPILAMSGHTEDAVVQNALDAGARGFLAKGNGVERVPLALRTILAGEFYLSDQLKPKYLRSF
jgi:DNA-binding NarL/FixJ family response regulator